jgi:hypothetical protein
VDLFSVDRCGRAVNRPDHDEATHSGAFYAIELMIGRRK